MIKERLKKRLELEEGRRATVYLDTKGIPTLGIGHNGRVPLSDRVIDLIYEEDVVAAEHALDSAIPWWREHDDIRQEVMLDLCFNMGIATLLKFPNMLRQWKVKNYEAASDHLAQAAWAKQVDDGVGGRYGRADRLFLMLRTGTDPDVKPAAA